MEQLHGIPTTFQNVTTTVKLRGKEVKIHGLCTGSVEVKTNFLKKKGPGELAKLNILLDRRFTDYLPIWVWVIEHPEGLLVIDTGENAQVANLDKYLENESWFLRFPFKHAAKFRILEEDELPHQFERISLKIQDVKLVILTHLHLDHTDGLRFFPKQEIIVAEKEWRHPISPMRSTYPSWFSPNKVHYQKDQLDVFDLAYPISGSGDLLYVPTPGHTPGHSSVLFKTDDFDILFSGDTSYTQDQVLRHELAGVNTSFKQTLTTYHKILKYSKFRKTIYLPTHDPNSGKRLVDQTFLF